jgi:uncharacterized protein YecE (DUF72 family)
VPVLIGTSGWQYAHWRGTFYPPELPVSHWLEHYAERFVTVESNSAFYRLPERRTFEAWAARTPDDFVMAVKASRYLTHVRRLEDPVEPVHRLADRLRGLGHKCGPVLLQLPPDLQLDRRALENALGAFPAELRVACEFRHPSWYTDEVRRVLEDHGSALCLTDSLGPRSPMWRTAEWGYVRFHQGRAHPPPCYGHQALDTWAARVARLWSDGEPIYCYFNNDQGGCAPRDAHRFGLAARRRGRTPTRTPTARELRLA